MALPAVRKISETIVDFGEPLLQELDANDRLEAVRSAFEIVIMIWNAHVTAMPRWGQPRFLADLQWHLQQPGTPAPMIQAFETLSRRRAELFAADARAVGEWSVSEQSGQWRLRCDARAPGNA